MTKQSAKNAIILVNGYVLSTWSTSYEVTQEVAPLDVTGFAEGFKNNTPGLITSKIATTMFWDSTAGAVHTALGALTTGQVTIIPEGYVVGNPSLSMPFMQANYSPKGTVDGIIEVGSIAYENYGTTNGVEMGVVLQHGTITTTTNGTGVLDPTNAAVTKACTGVLHIWTAALTDTYVIKIQHSTNNSTWADLITFTKNGSAIGAERITVASGTINKYRRIIATNTGGAANPFGFTVHFFHNN